MLRIKDRIHKHIRDGGKSIFIHLDLLEGIGRDQKAVDYLADVIRV